MDRASDYGSEGWGFESLQAHEKIHSQKPRPAGLFAFLATVTSTPNKRSSNVSQRFGQRFIAKNIKIQV